VLVYDSKTKRRQLVLVNELIVQLDSRVDYLIRQKATLKMCRQDMRHIDELLLCVTKSLVRTRAIKERLQADLSRSEH
jgi:hypothetical protein